MQSNTIAQGLKSGFGLDPLICGISLAICAGAIIIGGKKRIANVAEVIVPIMALAYLAMTLFVVLNHLAEVPLIIKNIINSAFSTQAAVGGVLGHTVKEAFRFGVALGIFLSIEDF